MMSRFSNLSPYAFVGLLTGCAADTSQIKAEYVSPVKYDEYTCKRLEGEAARLIRRAEEVGARVDKTAADDDAQTGVGLILFWPALFFLEGEETADTKEFARLRGEMEALEEVSIKKECGIEFKSLPASGQMHKGQEQSVTP